MSRLEKGLLLLVICEALGATALVATRLAWPLPPPSEPAWVDRLTAAEIRQVREELMPVPGDPKAWKRLADAYLAFGAFAEADACYRRCSERDPAAHAVAYDWGVCLEKMGRTAEARAQFQRAVTLAPSGHPAAQCWYQVGRCFLREEDTAAAQEAFQNARLLPMARYQWARILVCGGKVEEALPLLKELLEEHPLVIEYNCLQARACEILGRAREAARYRELEEQAVEVAPLDFSSQRMSELRTGYAVERRFAELQKLKMAGDWEGAAAGLRELFELQWEPGVAKHLIEAELRAGHAARALELCNEYIDKTSATPLILRWQGESFLHLGREDEAREAWEHGLRLGDLEPLHTDLARYYEKHGQKDLARLHEAKALHAQGVEAYRRERFEEAVEALEQAVRLAPRQAESWLFLGEAWRRQADTSRARSAYQHCLEIDPHHGCGRAQARLAELSASEPAILLGPKSGNPK